MYQISVLTCYPEQFKYDVTRECLTKKKNKAEAIKFCKNNLNELTSVNKIFCVVKENHSPIGCFINSKGKVAKSLDDLFGT